MTLSRALTCFSVFTFMLHATNTANAWVVVNRLIGRTSNRGLLSSSFYSHQLVPTKRSQTLRAGLNSSVATKTSVQFLDPKLIISFNKDTLLKQRNYISQYDLYEKTYNNIEVVKGRPDPLALSASFVAQRKSNFKVKLESLPSAGMSKDTNTTSVNTKKRTKSTVVAVSSKRLKSDTTIPKTLQETVSTSLASPIDFTVASYNLWFGPEGNGDPMAETRMQAVYKILTKESSNFPPLLAIGLQEVVPELAQALFPLLEQSNYQIFRQPQLAHYGVALCIHKSAQIISSGWRPYRDSCMDRGFVYAHIKYSRSCDNVDGKTVNDVIDLTNDNDVELLVATTHLESFQRMPAGKPDYTGVQQRQTQIKEFNSFATEYKKQHVNIKTILFLGDLNWDDESQKPIDPPLLTCINGNEKNKDNHEWQDASFVSQSNSASKIKNNYTYDGKLNPMLNNNLRRRFDRCLFLSQDKQTTTNSCKVIKTQLVGTQPIENKEWQKYNPWKGTSKSTPLAPSDHFGLLVHFQIS